MQPPSMEERLKRDYRWSARQRRVLDGLVSGKTNQQIGDDLGITLDGAKWHVSEILRLLGAATREEAAEYWRRANGLAPRFARVFRGLVGLGAIRVASISVLSAFGPIDAGWRTAHPVPITPREVPQMTRATAAVLAYPRLEAPLLR